MKLNLKNIIKSLVKDFIRKIFNSKEIFELLEPSVYALIIRSDSEIYAIDPKDDGVGGQLRRNGKYGISEVERLKKYLTLDSKVLVVGAHVGTLTIPISKICKEVTAIEANPDTFELLKINLALNSISNCLAINIGASDKDENIEFLKNTANSGGSKRVPKIKESIYYYDRPEQISIKAYSLDTYLEQKKFDVVVMDIEGSEYFALRGMQEILSKCRVLVVEFLPHHLKNVSGVSVEQLLSVIQPHFSQLTIPSQKVVLDVSDFSNHLTKMYDLNQEDEGIIFEKL